MSVVESEVATVRLGDLGEAGQDPTSLLLGLPDHRFNDPGRSADFSTGIQIGFQFAKDLLYVIEPRPDVG